MGEYYLEKLESWGKYKEFEKCGKYEGKIRKVWKIRKILRKIQKVWKMRQI